MIVGKVRVAPYLSNILGVQRCLIVAAGVELARQMKPGIDTRTADGTAVPRPAPGLRKRSARERIVRLLVGVRHFRIDEAPLYKE